MIEKVKVSQDTLDKKGVATLRTYPSKLGTFGQNGLDAEALKQKFDELPEAIATQFNALCDILIAGKLEEAMAFVNSLADGDGKKRAVDILNALTVIGNALAYNGKALATQEYTDGKVAEEASARTAAIAEEASAREAEDAKKADKTAVEAALATKVDTPQNSSGKDRVLVSRAGGAVQTWAMSDAPLGNAVVKFGANKTLSSADAVADDNTVTLRQLKAAIADLVNGAPEALDTLKEIAEALGNNDNAYGALVATIAEKADAKQTESALAGKLDKVTSKDFDRVYVATYNGGQETKPVTSSASSWTIPQREGGGATRVGTATRDDHAVNLAQMNEALATKAERTDLSNLVSRVDELERNGGGGGSATVKLVDNTAAYQKRIPKDVLPVAAITEIGGASEYVESIRDNYAWSQFEGNEYTGEEYGSLVGRVTVRANGELYVENLNDYGYNGEIDLPIKVRDIFPNAVIGKKYQLRYSLECNYMNTYGDRMGFGGVDVNSPFTMTEEIYNSTMWVWAVSWEEVYYDPETGEGISSMMYPADASYTNIELVPYDKEIGKWYDTKATSVQVLGRNLCQFTPKEYTTYGVTVTISDDGTITLNGKCTSSWGSINAELYIPSGARYILRDFAEGEFPNNTQPRTSVTGGGGSPRHIWTCNNGNLENAIGTVSLSGYYDYVWLTIPLTNGFTYNNCKLRPMLVIGVDEPKEFIPGKKQTFNIPSAVYDLPAYGYGYDKELYNRIVFKDDGSVIYQQRVSADHKPLSPFVETDITDTLGWDGFIDVEGGGIITFKNQYSELIPSTVVYQTK